jgi:hypothetical protein
MSSLVAAAASKVSTTPRRTTGRAGPSSSTAAPARTANCPRLAQRPGEQDRPDRGRSRAVQERLRDPAWPSWLIPAPGCGFMVLT